MKKLIVIFLSCLALDVVAQSTGPLLWQRSDRRPGISTPAGAPFDMYKDVKFLSSGNAIALGEVGGIGAASGGDIVLRRHDHATGAVIGEVFIDNFLAGTSDRAVKLLVSEPYIYVVTNAEYFLSPFDNDFYIYKMDTALNVVWSAVVNSPGDADDLAVDAGLDLFGNLYVVGSTVRTASGEDIILCKFSGISGALLFSKYYTSTGNFSDVPTAMAVEPNGTCNITGYYTSATLGTRMLALKLWGNGVQLWVKYYDVVTGAVSPDIGNSVSYDPVTGDMFVCGTGRNSFGNNDWVVVKFSGVDGTRLWFKRHSGASNANDDGVEVVYSNGSLYSAGTFTSSISGVVSQNMQLRKYNPASGDLLYTKTYNVSNGPADPSVETTRTMIVSPGGVVFLGGTAAVFNLTGAPGTYQVALAYSSSGTLLWAHTQPNAAVSSAFQGIAVAALDYSVAHNSLIMAGFQWGTMSVISSSTVLKFSPASPVPSPLARVSVLDAQVDAPVESKVFPNPAIDFLRFQKFSDGDGVLSILDISGRMVSETLIQDDITSIDVQALPSGLYLLRFTQGDKTECLRFVKQ